MEKEQSKGIVIKHEIKKERVLNFPYYLVTAVYSHEQDYHFIVTVDYSLDSTILSLYPFKQDMARLPVCTIPVINLFTRKAVSVLHVSRLLYKTHSHGVTITEASFILGHRSGQLALVEYKQRACKIAQRLNKTTKHEGFFNKTSSFLFGAEESYTPYFKQPIKDLQVHPAMPDFRYSYQVGNHILLMRDFLENTQSSFLHLYATHSPETFASHHDFNSPVEKGSLSMFGNDDYYAMKDSSKDTALLKFSNEVSSYAFLDFTRHELAVALRVRETILVLDTSKLTLKCKLSTQMSIRRLSYFTNHEKQYLAIMFYEDYVLIYDLNQNKYCKLVGHRSFIANVGFVEKEQMIVSAGMDHRIALVKMADIKPPHWESAVLEGVRTKIEDSDCPSLRFPDIYSLGEYNNVRTNLHSYGFAEFIIVNGHFCLPTYDAKIMIYKYS